MRARDKKGIKMVMEKEIKRVERNWEKVPHREELKIGNADLIESGVEKMIDRIRNTEF